MLALDRKMGVLVAKDPEDGELMFCVAVLVRSADAEPYE
jgi:hypothetical protein